MTPKSFHFGRPSYWYHGHPSEREPQHRGPARQPLYLDTWGHFWCEPLEDFKSIRSNVEKIEPILFFFPTCTEKKHRVVAHRLQRTVDRFPLVGPRGATPRRSPVRAQRWINLEFLIRIRGRKLSVGGNKTSSIDQTHGNNILGVRGCDGIGWIPCCRR